MLTGFTEAGIGIITSSAYDFLKGKISENLRPNFEKIYNETINELIKEHPKAKNYLKRFLKCTAIKNLTLDKIPRQDKLKKMVELGEQIKKPSEKNIEVKKVINDFYIKFKEKIKLNQHLWAKIEEEYLTKVIEITLDTKKGIELLNKEFSKNTQDIIEEVRMTKKEILKQIEEKAEFKYIKRAIFFPLLICATQFKIDRVSLENISNNINNFTYTSKEKMQLISKENNRLILEYLPKKENNVIKLTNKGMPYKIIYPPFNKISILVEPFSGRDYLLVTIFSNERAQINRLKHILFGELLNTNVKEVTFKGKMKLITKKFLIDLTVFDYDPLIYKPIKVKGIEIKEKANRTIMFGEKGFLRRPEMQQVVKKVKMEREKQITDIFFVKAEDSTKLSEDPVTLEIQYRGSLAGYFPRSKFTENQAKKIICTFFEKFGNFEN
jgi:hypothetical protein